MYSESQHFRDLQGPGEECHVKGQLDLSGGRECCDVNSFIWRSCVGNIHRQTRMEEANDWQYGVLLEVTLGWMIRVRIGLAVDGRTYAYLILLDGKPSH